MTRAHVITGGGRGIGRAIAERLLADGERVVLLEMDPDAVAWTANHPASDRLAVVVGDASDESAAEEAARFAEARGTLVGWVNNAAVFRDASVHTASAAEILRLIESNVAPAVVGSAVAVRCFLAAGTPGAIVNVSSHQATRPVPGCLPYATAKAAVEGLTRALAVEYGSRGVRANAVALGSVETERYRTYLDGEPAEAARRVEAEIARLHPLGRVGRAAEVADAVAYLLSDRAAFITGTTLPVDGGRAALGRDPEAHDTV